jgi:hypothetical protein
MLYFAQVNAANFIWSILPLDVQLHLVDDGSDLDLILEPVKKDGNKIFKS